MVNVYIVNVDRIALAVLIASMGIVIPARFTHQRPIQQMTKPPALNLPGVSVGCGA